MKKKSLLLFLLSAVSALTLFACTSCTSQEAGQSSSNSSSASVSDDEAAQEPFLSLSKTELNELVIGDSEIIFADFAELDGVSLSWSNSNDNVAQIETLNKYACKVTAMRVGETTVTATYGTLQKTCTLKVSLNNLYPSLEFENDKSEVVNVFPNSKLDLSTYVAFNGKKFDDADIEYTVADTSYGTVNKEEQAFTSSNKLGLTTVKVKASWRGVASELLEKTVTIKVVAPKTVILKDESGKDIQKIDLYTVASFEGKTYKNEQVVSTIVVQEASADIADYTVAITDSVASDGSDTPVAVWDSANKKVIANAYGSAKLTVSFTSPATGEPFAYSFDITAERPVAQYKTPIQNFSWLLGDIPVDTIFKDGSTTILDAEQEGRALSVVDNKLTDVMVSEHTQMCIETVTVYNEKVGYVLDLETYAMSIDSAEAFKAYLDSNEPRTIIGYFALQKDIVIKEAWNTYSDKMTFGGVLDGNGHTLSVPMRGYGVFGIFKGTLKNIHLHVTNVTNMGKYKYTSLIFESAYAGAKVQDMYVTLDLAKNASFPQTFSLFGSSDNGFAMSNFVADLGDKIPETGYGYSMYGLLFQYISYLAEDKKNETLYDNVYVISSGMKVLAYRHDKAEGNADNNNVYAGNDTALYDAHTPIAGENKYKIATINRYNTYADFVGAENAYEDFNTDCWEIINGGLYWKGVYAKSARVVVTDKSGEPTEQYELRTTTDELNLSLVDIFGNAFEDVEYSIANNDGCLQVQNGKVTLVSTVAEDKNYTVNVAVTVNGVKIEKSVVITAIEPRTTYTQEVYLATDTDYTGTDEYVLTNAGFASIPTNITRASLNGVALTVTDGKLPDISIKHIKEFESGTYGKTRTTYINVLVDGTTIISKKSEQTPLTLMLKTATATIEFTNLLVCTDVISVATDLNRFSITYYEKEADKLAHTNAGYYVMSNNIDAKDLVFKHKADAYDPSRRFVGTFDGRGYTISNLNVNQSVVGVTGSNTAVYGLFGNLYGADILNVGFVNVSAEGGSVLGSHSSYLYKSYCQGEALLYAENIYPDKNGDNVYASTRIENVYIQVADSVTSMKGALCPTFSDYNFLKNVVVEWNPTNASALSAGYGSLVGSGVWTDVNKPKRENVILLSSVQLNNDTAFCAGVKVYADRATMQSQNTDSLAGFGEYWTTTSNAPVWNSASWQDNN